MPGTKARCWPIRHRTYVREFTPGPWTSAGAYLVRDHERSDREAFTDEVPLIICGQSDVREVDDRGEDGARVEEAASDVFHDVAHEEGGLHLERSLVPRRDHSACYRGDEHIDEEFCTAGCEPQARYA